MVSWADVGRFSVARGIARKLLRLPVARRLVAAAAPLDRLDRFAARRDVHGSVPSGALPVVIVVSHELSATGAPKVLVEVLTACREAGWDVVVVAPSDGPYRSVFVDMGALVVVAPDALTNRTPVVDFGALAQGAICNTVVTFEVVRALQPSLPVAWYLHENALIAEMCANDPRVRDAIRSTPVVWAASELTAEAVRFQGGEPEVLGGSCAPLVASISQLPAIDREPVANFVLLGSVEPRKGQDLLLGALELLQPATRAALRVTLYGKPLDPEYTKAVLARIERSDSVRYFGAVPPDEAVAAVLESDVVIVPSRDDPLPLVAVEALSAGRVLVCSVRCGISHDLVDGSNAFVARDCSASELARTIEVCMARRADWAVIGRAGRAVYDEHFSTDRFREQVAATLATFWETPPREKAAVGGSFPSTHESAGGVQAESLVPPADGRARVA